MNIDKKTYKKFADAHAPKSPLVKDCLWAFCVGGGICAFAQGLKDIYMKICGIPETDAGTWTSVTLIFIAVVLTGIGIFDKIAKHAGAGTLVPITGFANSVASPAIEFRREGLIMGIGAKLFVISGPVLVYGITSSIIVGILYWLFGRLLG